MEAFLEEFADLIASKVSDILINQKKEINQSSKKETILLTTKEASKYFGKHINTIRNWIKEGELPSKKIGNSLYVIIKEEKNEK